MRQQLHSDSSKQTCFRQQNYQGASDFGIALFQAQLRLDLHESALAADETVQVCVPELAELLDVPFFGLEVVLLLVALLPDGFEQVAKQGGEALTQLLALHHQLGETVFNFRLELLLVDGEAAGLPLQEAQLLGHVVTLAEPVLDLVAAGDAERLALLLPGQGAHHAGHAQMRLQDLPCRQQGRALLVAVHHVLGQERALLMAQLQLERLALVRGQRVAVGQGGAFVLLISH